MLYHLSYTKDLSILKPFVPKTANPLFEDTKTSRVCFSDSIDNCLSAIMPCFERNIYVYVPVKKLKVYKPKISEVRDCKKTNEVWALNEVNVKCIGCIKVTGELKKERFKNYKGYFNVFYYAWEWSNI